MSTTDHGDQKIFVIDRNAMGTKRIEMKGKKNIYSHDMNKRDEEIPHGKTKPESRNHG